MSKKKVTLSIESEVYNNFQKYCEENAIMLSKKIEILMKSIVKNKKNFLLLIFTFFLMSMVLAFQTSDNTQNDFNNGTHNKTIHNGTSLILSGNNLSGNFTSRILNVSFYSNFDSIQFNYDNQNIDYLFAVDSAADVWKSTNAAVNFTLRKSDYNGANGNGINDIAKNSSGTLFILHGTDFWKSDNRGVNWTYVNTDFNGGGDSNSGLFVGVDNMDYIYIIDGSEDVFKSTDNGVIFTKVNGSDFNGGSGNVQGMTINASGSIFVVDNQANVWKSDDDGTTWTRTVTDYNGRVVNAATFMGSNSFGTLYILHTNDFWKSDDSGFNWTLVNADFNGGGDSNNGVVFTVDLNGNIYVVDGSQDVYLSSDGGVSFTKTVTDLNGANGGVGGIISFRSSTSLMLQVRNCSTVCTSEPFAGQNGNTTNYFNQSTSNLNLTGNYFQYKVYFSSEETGFTSRFNSLYLNYSIIDSQNPNLTLYSPENRTHNSSSILLNFSASDASGIGSCFYSLDFGSNQSLSGCNPIYINSLGEGGHTIILYANDSLGNLNTTTILFAVDTTRPNIIIYSPENKTYATGNISLNFSASDASGIGSCFYSLDFGSNQTLASCANTTITPIVSGNHFIILYANDTLGNLNYSTINFSIDILGPNITVYSPTETTYNSNILINFSSSDQTGISSCLVYLDSTLISTSCSNFVVSPSNGFHLMEFYSNDTLNNFANKNVSFTVDFSPPIYSSMLTNHLFVYNNSNSTFNITWNDTSIDFVAFESNFSGISRNYSMTSIGEGKYSFSAVMSAGTYYWKSYANDSFGNMNATIQIEFTINKSTNGANLYLNGNDSNLNISYGNTVNGSFTSVNNLGLLYLNGLGIIGGQSLDLSAGTYNYTLYFPGNENYTEKTISYFAYVNKANPDLKLLLNGFSSSIGVSVFNLVNITSYSSQPALANIEVFENGISQGTGTLLNFSRNYSSPGTFMWKVNISESQNYTYGELERQVDVYDANYPSYFNLIASPDHLATYSANKIYRFNISWIDDIGINDVIFQFNNINYSYLSAEISQNGNEYYITIIDLPVGSYSYRWYANDTSGNLVASPNEVLTVSKATASMVITTTPGISIEYGELMSVNCIANNIESNRILTLQRNFENVNNPDTLVLGAGIYNYICDAASTQNYTDPNSASTQLNVNKATPDLELTLNNASGDITLPVGGGNVNIVASLNLLYGVEANLTLYINGNLTYSNVNSIDFNQTVTSNSNITVQYSGNENYSSISLSRFVAIDSPSPPIDNGGGSTSRGSGGSGGGSVMRNKTLILEFESLGDIIISPGESKILELNVKNTGETFLNKCRLRSDENYTSWIKSDTNKNINPGEITEYIFEIIVPLEAKNKDDPKLILECLERDFDVPIKTMILNSGMDIEIDSLSLISNDKLEMNYTVIGNDDFEENIVFKVYDFEDNLLSLRDREIEVSVGKTPHRVVLDVSKAEKGLLKVEISKRSGAIIIDEFFVYDSRQSITGFALLDKIGGNSFYFIFVTIFFLIVAFLILKRMHSVGNIKKWDSHNSPDKELKESREKVVDLTAKKYEAKKIEVEPKTKEAKKVKWGEIFRDKQKIETNRQSTTKLKDEILDDKFRFQTYGKNNSSRFETY